MTAIDDTIAELEKLRALAEVDLGAVWDEESVRDLGGALSRLDPKTHGARMRYAVMVLNEAPFIWRRLLELREAVAMREALPLRIADGLTAAADSAGFVKLKDGRQYRIALRGVAGELMGEKEEKDG